jgi:1-phosphofructokinase
MIGTITLNPSIDRHVMVPQLVKDDANRATDIFETAGGKGINVSKVVRELGGKTRAYALLGGFAGDYLNHLAKPLDFPLIAVSVRGNTRINTVISDKKDGTQTRISAPGPCISQGEVRRLMRMLLSVRPRPRLWALGGSISTGMKATVYRDLIHLLQKEGTSCILDTDDEALAYGVQAGPFMIKPNEFEIARLCGKDVDTVP